MNGARDTAQDISSRRREQEALAQSERAAALLEARREVQEKLLGEQKRAEQALRRSHDELRVIYDSMVDGMLVMDHETGQIVRVNNSLCRMLGLAREEMLSRKVADFHLDVQFHAPAEDHFPLEPRIVANMPLPQRGSGRMYVDLVAQQTIYNDRPAMIAFLRDVTERRLAEETLDRMLQASDHERQLIAYEIHDGLAQHLAVAIMQMEAFHHLVEKKSHAAEKAYDLALAMMQRAHFEARRLINGVRPPILDDEGIVPALDHLVAEFRMQKGPKVEFQCDVEFGRLSPMLENALYRIVQESLTNARKHSQARQVRLELSQHERRVRLRIEDDGVGFIPETAGKGRFGLHGIRERVRLLDGEFSLQTEKGRGTRISIEFPLLLS